MPFGVALTSDVYDPWTETSHKFRYYRQPEDVSISVVESNVGVLTEVLVSISPSESKKDNVFFEPLPNNMAGISTDSDY